MAWKMRRRRQESRDKKEEKREEKKKMNALNASAKVQVDTALGVKDEKNRETETLSTQMFFFLLHIRVSSIYVT